jgi:hypothetical protein
MVEQTGDERLAEIRKEIRYTLAELALDHGHDDIISVRADVVTAALAELFAKRIGADR